MTVVVVVSLILLLHGGHVLNGLKEVHLVGIGLHWLVHCSLVPILRLLLGHQVLEKICQIVVSSSK
jgi:hypothetical protein